VSGLLYQLRDDFPDQLRLTRANVVGNVATAQNYGVRGAPTVLIFHKGRLVKRWNVRIDVDELYAVLEGLLEVPSAHEPGKTPD
jgi:thioredoxin-like negative regulator of GroEL